MPSYEVAFGYKEPIWIKALKVGGIIVAILRDGEGVQYKVVYWNEGERKEAWLFEEELGQISAGDKKAMGF